MRVLLLLVSWVFSILVGLMTLSMFLTRNWLQGIVLLAATLALLPPVRKLVHHLSGRQISGWIWAGAAIVLLAAFMLLSGLNTADSVYTLPEAQAKHEEIYSAKLAAWPVPYEEIYVDTSYGKMHVIVSWPEDAPPALLLNASGMSAWSWLYNVGELNKHYRTYAVDTLGEAGKSVLTDLNHIPASGKDHADMHVEITDALGIPDAYVVGASYGGYLATNYALYYPERVKKLALLGPMGMTPATGKTVARIMLVQFFPIKPFQQSTVRWALGDDPKVLAESEEWFRYVMTGMFPKVSQPVTFTPEQLQQVQTPVLLVLGAKDALTSDPEAVKELASNVPDIQVVVLDTGHLIGVEQPERVNELIIGFFEE